MSAPVRVPIAEIVRAFSLRLRLARSAELALAGSLYRAEELLRPNGDLPESAEELDLLARILVRQKRYAEAQKSWNDALRVSGGKHCYQDALISLNTQVFALQKRNRILLLTARIFTLILSVTLTFIVIRQ